MTEAQYTQRFHRRLRERYPHFVVGKLNDRSTAGIPDGFVAGLGHTLWVEYKAVKLGLTKLQRYTIRRLHAATDGRAVTIVFLTDGRIQIHCPDGAPRFTCEGIDPAIDILFAILSEGDQRGS